MAKGLFKVAGWSAAGIAVVMLLTLIGGVVVGFLTAHGTLDRDQGVLWVMIPIAALLMIGAMLVSVAWMRSIDEAAREAHKAAWFWGGCSGMGLGGVGVVVASLPQSVDWSFPAWFDGRTDPAAYVATGAIGISFLMIVGYAIVWAWWWLRRR